MEINHNQSFMTLSAVPEVLLLYNIMNILLSARLPCFTSGASNITWYSWSIFTLMITIAILVPKKALLINTESEVTQNLWC